MLMDELAWECMGTIKYKVLIVKILVLTTPCSFSKSVPLSLWTSSSCGQSVDPQR